MWDESVYHQQRQTDFRALLPRIEASGAEAIIAVAGMPESVTLVRLLRELNINVKMVAVLRDAETPEFVEKLGSTAEYVVGYSSWPTYQAEAKVLPMPKWEDRGRK